MEQFISTIFLLGAIQGFILSLVLFMHRKKSKNHLTYAIFFISTALLFTFLEIIIDYTKYPFFIKSSETFSLLFMPFLYLYILDQVHKPIANKWILFIPFIIHLAYVLPFHFGDGYYKIEYANRVYKENSMLIVDKIEIFYNVLVSFLFSICSYSAIRKHRQLYQEKLIDDKKKGKWIHFLVFSMLFLTGFSLITILLQLLKLNVPGIINLVSAIGGSIVVYSIGYFALKNPVVFNITQSISANAAAKSTPVKKSTEINSKLLIQKINTYLINEKPFIDPECTLNNFSKKIEIPTYIVSKVINSETGHNFQSYINKHRIEEFKKLALQPENKNESIIDLAYSVGFNTKSAFYSHFKAVVGTSPSEFIKSGSKSTR